MAKSYEGLSLPKGADTLLYDLIHERIGLFYDTDEKSEVITEKLAPLVIERGFNSFLDYYYLLKYDESEAPAEWRRVMNALSVQETYFWREMEQIHALVNVIVPDWFAKNPNETLRIWSAACASGEEPLTIAMALNEAGWLDRAPIEIYASDASDAALEKARKGLYRERSFRSLAPDLREKYFTPEESVWRIQPQMHERIFWHTANLMLEDEIMFLASVPFVFCRNVFIYFSASAIQKTVKLFSDRMPANGLLFLGASESLLKLNTDFELKEIDDAFVYEKLTNNSSDFS